MPLLPPDPATLNATAFRAAARRDLRVFGAEVELVLLPERAARPSRPTPQRPPFGKDPVPRILAAEAQWRGDGLALTGNRYPFAAGQHILWLEQPAREPGEELLAVLFGWNDAHRGTALLNTIGAAASIARAHAHWTAERLPFLGAFGERPLAADWLPEAGGVAFVQKALPYVLLGVRGAAAARARAVAALLRQRLCTAANVVDADGTAWIYPRSRETPAPHFPAALGAAEVWGRWCYADEAPFRAATAHDLEQALVVAGCAATDA